MNTLVLLLLVLLFVVLKLAGLYYTTKVVFGYDSMMSLSSTQANLVKFYIVLAWLYLVFSGFMMKKLKTDGDKLPKIVITPANPTPANPPTVVVNPVKPADNKPVVVIVSPDKPTPQNPPIIVPGPTKPEDSKLFGLF